ncbi:helix-loop-helix DNA-binding domain-containing transcription factor [Rhizophagus clarus]|uniref:Helix-loop-helix DNA-binding domain-containing transcription factor n=1 Tax=Rhizophagus clarus TaxID=94130 RepID=A0A8H3LGP0_9GLOM|nr:helix-loop-helix DNA-binding domain-containing transcription factor [Rhizophagus clarus]
MHDMLASFYLSIKKFQNLTSVSTKYGHLGIRDIAATSCFVMPAGSPQTPVVNTASDELDIPEFKQYNKEIYESSKSGNRRRRKTTREDCDTASSLDGYDGEDGNGSVTHAEFRRQIHIQSEQRRRAEIKDGFEELRRQLPINNNGRKMSKALLLQKTVAHLKNMKSKETFLIEEVNRLHQYISYLAAELEREKRLNAVYQQQDTLDKIYAIGL